MQLPFDLNEALKEEEEDNVGDHIPDLNLPNERMQEVNPINEKQPHEVKLNLPLQMEFDRGIEEELMDDNGPLQHQLEVELGQPISMVILGGAIGTG